MTGPPRRGRWPTLLLVLLALVAGAAAVVLADAIHAALWQPGTDLTERIQEFRLFRNGFYPHHRLVPRPLPPGFRTTPYPPWALPMFGLVVGWRDGALARLTMLVVNLLALAVIGGDAWQRLRWAGRTAGCAAVLGCVAIAGNVNAFANGQFSLLCMALITLQARLLARRRPLAAGLCWSLAMVKPQIALPFALSFLGEGRRRGLVAGTTLLLALSALAFLYTGVSPFAWAAAWARPSALAFASEGQTTVMGLLVGPWPVASALVVPALAATALGLALRRRGWRGLRMPRPTGLDALGVMAVLGALLFYHRNYDNIMLVPALLALFQRSLRGQAPATIALTAALALSLWLPTRVVVALPWLMPAQSLVWLLAGLVLAFTAAPGEAMTRARAQPT